MRVGLFIPCYINQFYPQVGVAVLELLERQNIQVAYPVDQTCCGQPMANSGFEHLTKDCNALFTAQFREFDYVVCPSGSCTLHLKEHLHVVGRDKETELLRDKIYELTEFLTDVVDVKSLPSKFPYKVGVHQSCHGQRGLKLSQMSELVAAPFSKPDRLLKMVEGLQLVSLTRTDECCGFGGLFSVNEEAVSVRMGKDRIEDFDQHEAEYITSADMSCLMHLDGILRRQKSKIQVIHIAEILNAR
jgi:L-lactate dehydrogenase complex protein LldE